MSYSIIARCPRTGQLGIAAAGYSLAIGMYCDGAVRPQLGATFTQGNPDPRNNRLALNLLAQGFGPGQVLSMLRDNDPHFAYRQVGVIDHEGSVAVHTGERLRAWSGHTAGEGYAAMGAGVAAAQVTAAMGSAYEAARGDDLDLRLLCALEAGRDAGGLAGNQGPLPDRSAALVVWGVRDYSDTDLRVDLHEHAVAQLRRIYMDYKPTAAYYDERARDPRNAISAKEFAARLERRRAQGAT